MDQRDHLRALNEFLRRHRGMERRQLLRAGLGLAIGSLLAPMAGVVSAQARPIFTASPFTLGVASGYPHANGFTLWTRLAPEPLAADGGMWNDFVIVDWEVAEDDQFGKVVAKGQARAVTELAHSVHVDVTGLRPDRWYFYRFRCGDEISRSGRTRTMPAADANTQRLRIAFGSCQHYQQAYFTAHRHIIAEQPDLSLFLGDYIYESNWGDDLVRRHHGDEAATLAGYRVRHAQYKTDIDLQDHHALVPFAFCWDDHEVDNDYADWRSEHLDPAFLLRRAAAYQAFYEHQPVPRSMVPRGPDMHIYTHLDFGRLARIYLLDNRQYRTVQPCPNPIKGGGSNDIDESCIGALDPKQTLLGAKQEQWLRERFKDSGARFNLIAQQTIFGRFDSIEGPKQTRFTDGWDGYPLARARLLADLERSRATNPVILGGDIHAYAVTHVRRDPDNFKSPIVAPEFCGTSIASQGWSDVAAFNARVPANPDVLFRRYDAARLRFDGHRSGGHGRSPADAGQRKAP
ncbi:MAG: alkaline phosphatase D family protein [Ahniella sp.]|nr:alkaline phosphatase D family protein [Ahniella sp.]